MNANLKYTAKQGANVIVSFLTINGTLVKRFSQISNGGSHVVQLDFGNTILRPGMYLVKCEIDGKAEILKYSVTE